MKPSTTGRRPARLAVATGAALAAAFALTACGSNGVMHDGRVAGTYDGQSVSNHEVQTAMKQISTVSQQGVDGESATAFILLLPKLEKIGQKHGVVVSVSQIRSAFPKNTDLKPATIKAARGSMLFGQLQQSAPKQVAKLLKNADVKLNPRYGRWVKGKGPSLDKSPWVKTVSQKSQPGSGS